MEKETIFADGLYFDRPRDGAPAFVKGRLSIQADKAIRFIQEHANADGWVRLDLQLSKNGKLYLKLDEWVRPAAVEEINPENIPF